MFSIGKPSPFCKFDVFRCFCKCNQYILNMQISIVNDLVAYVKRVGGARCDRTVKSPIQLNVAL